MPRNMYSKNAEVLLRLAKPSRSSSSAGPDENEFLAPPGPPPGPPPPSADWGPPPPPPPLPKLRPTQPSTPRRVVEKSMPVRAEAAWAEHSVFVSLWSHFCVFTCAHVHMPVCPHAMRDSFVVTDGDVRHGRGRRGPSARLGVGRRRPHRRRLRAWFRGRLRAGHRTRRSSPHWSASSPSARPSTKTWRRRQRRRRWLIGRAPMTGTSRSAAATRRRGTTTLRTERDRRRSAAASSDVIAVRKKCPPPCRLRSTSGCAHNICINLAGEFTSIVITHICGVFTSIMVALR